MNGNGESAQSCRYSVLKSVTYWVTIPIQNARNLFVDDVLLFLVDCEVTECCSKGVAGSFWIAREIKLRNLRRRSKKVEYIPCPAKSNTKIFPIWWNEYAIISNLSILCALATSAHQFLISQPQLLIRIQFIRNDQTRKHIAPSLKLAQIGG